MSLYAYLTRLEDTLRSRHDITLETVRLTLTSIGAIFEADVRFHDDSRLIIAEEVEQVGRRDIRRVMYKYQYQHANGTLIFRYDNAPHYPHLSTFPSHKHIADSVVEAEPPDLSDVLREIDGIIYPEL
ncbi:MAG: hypothetical protein D6791_02375 [Chloroflexi bacterium]|nr:MAG: hypothetical protein D6791_02375 [Chloroflexota bacterium]